MRKTFALLVAVALAACAAPMGHPGAGVIPMTPGLYPEPVRVELGDPGVGVIPMTPGLYPEPELETVASGR